MMYVNARTIRWLAIYLAILPLFMIPQIVWASHVAMLDRGATAPEMHLAFTTDKIEHGE